MSRTIRVESGLTWYREWKIFLGRLDAAGSALALDLPGYRLHRLKGDLKRCWSVTVRANWRIVFRFEGVDVFDVELIDYH